MDRVVIFEPRGTLGECMRRLRERRGMSLEALAARMEDQGYPIHLSALSRYEVHRVRTIELATVQAIAKALAAPELLKLACQQIRQALPKDMPPGHGAGATVEQLMLREVG